jgi:phosphate transport system substrate-binding protein
MAASAFCGLIINTQKKEKESMRSKFLLPLLIALAPYVLLSCDSRGPGGENADTPTAGKINISVDQNFYQILDSQVDTFESLYKYANVTPSYKPEGLVIQDLLQDSARLVVMSRQLTPEENQVFDNLKIRPRITKIAIDAIALIVHPDNPNANLTLEQARNIFTGQIKSWKEINPQSPLSDIRVVFDNKNSSTVRYVMDSLTHNQPLPSNSFAAETNEALVDYVAKDKNAIGVIGVNWISDVDDTTAVNFLNRIKVVALAKSSQPSSLDDYLQPHQAYIAQRTYPLLRDVYIISREARAGLGTGFASFVAGDKGQRIILKSGLVPATMPVRIIGVR